MANEKIENKKNRLSVFVLVLLLTSLMQGMYDNKITLTENSEDIIEWSIGNNELGLIP